MPRCFFTSRCFESFSQRALVDDTRPARTTPTQQAAMAQDDIARAATVVRCSSSRIPPRERAPVPAQMFQGWAHRSKQPDRNMACRCLCLQKSSRDMLSYGSSTCSGKESRMLEMSARQHSLWKCLTYQRLPRCPRSRFLLRRRSQHLCHVHHRANLSSLAGCHRTASPLHRGRQFQSRPLHRLLL